jgi:signal transduction histidine kinase
MRIGASYRPALRVATAATIAAAVVYLLLIIGVLTMVSHKLVHETDARLADQLHNASGVSLAQLATRATSGPDTDDAPVYLWRFTPANRLAAATAGAPVLPVKAASANQRFPRTVPVDGRQFRFDEFTLADGSRLFAGESLVQEHHIRSVISTSALLVSPVMLAGVFASAFVIGRQAAKPVEQARKRQLEFTADASHELRTPLSVMQAEVGLALATNRTASGYRDALERIARESQRLHRIVDDLLWLARFDSEPPLPHPELVDVTAVVRQCAARFEPVLRSKDMTLTLETDDGQAQIVAAPDGIDRLVGVLFDNATRYAGAGGHVVVRIECPPGHVALTVADDGPGIPATERARLFDRFHRIDAIAGSTGQGAGLGLAIADAVVRSSNGHWTVGESALGGASMTITWPRPRRSPSSGNRRQEIVRNVPHA